MSAGRMHADEADIDVALVGRMLEQQFAHWADLAIEPLVHTGTSNAIYRLGDDMYVRLPRMAWAISEAETDHTWLPRFAPRLPLAVPVQLAQGAPAEGYPWHWSIYRWIDGETAAIERLTDPCQAAVELAEFVAALRRLDSSGGPLAVEPGSRGMPLAPRDASVRNAIEAVDAMPDADIDADAVTAAWEAALEAPEWDRAPVWFHGDLMSSNVLVERGRLSAVIDFGCLGVGDPACDLMIAWSLFSGESRDVFRATLGVDDAAWARGRGFALGQALSFIPYYVDTNPVGVASARHMLDAVAADFKRSGQ